MPTVLAVQGEDDQIQTQRRGLLARVRNNRFVRDVLVFLTFCVFTSIITWPYVTRLRDAVVDPGDPYFMSWVLWWDYHQTFTDPLNLFHANLYYPLRYTLAFSEHSYGIAMLFFPLFALGARPLTVHAVAVFLGFAGCGYAAFRLVRTLTGCTGAAWIAGIIFAFVPFRFLLMSQVVYLWSMWIPLVLEALVLFARRRSKRRAVWLGIAFFMSGLTTISWFTLSLVPLGVSAVILLTRHDIWRDREFWRRGVMALGAASLALLPFMLPYFIAARLYNFKRSIDEVKMWSAWPSHWLAAESRNKLWHGMGDNLPDGRFRLFPGLLPILLSLGALLLKPLRSESSNLKPQKESEISDPTSEIPDSKFQISEAESNEQSNEQPRSGDQTRAKWVRRLDALAVVALVISIPAIGYDRTGALHGLYNYVTSERALALLAFAIIARLCLAYPSFLRRENENFIQTLRSPRRSDAFWLGLAWTIIGFCFSLGWNFFFYRFLYDVLPLFRSMRVAARGAMIAYLGLAILAALGAQRLAEYFKQRNPRRRATEVFALLAVMLLLELNVAPLKFMRGDVFPDAVTVRLKETPMRGGVVVLPANEHVNHRHMLRSADHMKPLIVGISGFSSWYEIQIELATAAGPIPEKFMTFLEDVPTSYLVIANSLIEPERRVDYENFLGREVAAGRLRFVNRFDGRDDLYAIVKTEPQAKSEATLPFAVETREWSALVHEDPVNVLGQYRSWSQAVYRFYVASFGKQPRFGEFLADVELIGKGVAANLPDQEQNLAVNLGEFARAWVERPKFKTLYKSTTNDRFVDELARNAGITLSAAERAAFVDQLGNGATTRAQVLLALVNNRDFVTREENRSLVLLHYFGYLHRNPDDPPDNNLNGYNFWIREVETSGDPGRLTRGFMASGENKAK